MGDDPDTAVTDVNGQFHHVTNASCADQALFTTIGSANPVLTGLTLARKVAEHVVSRHLGHPEAGPAAPRSLLPADGWHASPYSGMRVVDSSADGVVETDPYAGIGLYWLADTFEDFELSVQWKAFRSYGVTRRSQILESYCAPPTRPASIRRSGRLQGVLRRSDRSPD